MSKKLTFASMLLLVLGGVAIPGGVVANDLIQDYVVYNTDTGLLGIKEEAGPIVENMVNCTFSSSLIVLAIFYLNLTEDGSETFFNDITEAGNITLAETLDQFAVKGVSFYYGSNLSFSPQAQTLLLTGNGTEGESDYIPGLINSTASGEEAAWDMIQFLENYELASNDLEKQNKMEDDYNCTWSQLEALVNYTKVYLFNDRIPDSISRDRHEDIKPILKGLETNNTLQIAEVYFYIQWANGSLVDDPGFPLPLGFMEAYGFEVGIPEATNMSYDSVLSLWNVSNEYSLVNKKGLARWNAVVANPSHTLKTALMSENGLTEGATDIILTWLPKFQNELMPYLAQYLYGLPADTTTLGMIFQFGGFIIGPAFIGLATIGFTKRSVSKKRSVGKLVIPKRVSEHVFASGLQPKEYVPPDQPDYSDDGYP